MVVITPQRQVFTWSQDLHSRVVQFYLGVEGLPWSQRGLPWGLRLSLGQTGMEFRFIQLIRYSSKTSQDKITQYKTSQLQYVPNTKLPKPQNVLSLKTVPTIKCPKSKTSELQNDPSLERSQASKRPRQLVYYDKIFQYKNFNNVYKL